MALQAMYEAETTGHSLETSLAWDPEEPVPGPVLEFATGLARGALQRRQELDAIVQRHAPAWPLSQMPAIDRAVLRLALYELLYNEETPPKVAVSEAVELAKRFGSESSARFVNGVLGSVMAERASARRKTDNTREGR